MYCHNTQLARIRVAALTLLLLGSSNGFGSEVLEKTLTTGNQAIKEGQASQQKIDGMVDETQTLFSEFKSVNNQIEGLKVYNLQLGKQIENQNKQLSQLEQSIRQASVMGRQIAPLTKQMLAALEQFIALDLPFHAEERQARLTKLKANQVRSDLTDAEKFRQILEAYQIEIEYGRKMDTYNSVIQLDNAEREVKIFRVGRIALLFQSNDANLTGFWNAQTKQWEQLDGGAYRNAVRQGVRIAKKQASIDILNLPIAAPESAK